MPPIFGMDQASEPIKSYPHGRSNKFSGRNYSHSSPARRRRNIFRRSRHCLIRVIQLGIECNYFGTCSPNYQNELPNVVPEVLRLDGTDSFSVQRAARMGGFNVCVPAGGSGSKIFRTISDFVSLEDQLKATRGDFPCLPFRECEQVDATGNILTNLLNDLLQTIYALDVENGTSYLHDFLSREWSCGHQPETNTANQVEVNVDSQPGPVSKIMRELRATSAPSVDHVWTSIADVVQALQHLTGVECLNCIATWLKRSTRASGRRHRDVYPLPPLECWPEKVPLDDVPQELAFTFANLSCGALNYLACNFKCKWMKNLARPAATKAQQKVQHHVATRVVHFLKRLVESAGGLFEWEGSFASFEPSKSWERLELDAKRVDLPDLAATCDPSRLIDPSLYSQICEPNDLFRSDLSKTLATKGPRPSERGEYVKLVVKQLLCGKVRLRQKVKAVGDVFVIPKANNDRLREVWNGSTISLAAKKPPTPEMLANPSCFVDVQTKHGEDLFFSKRDVLTCFDIIQAPESVQEWFGRPPVSVAELMAVSNIDKSVLLKWVDGEGDTDLDDSCLLYPVSTVLPMGFSWSSTIAQSCTVTCCRNGGVPPESFMCLDKPMPSCQTELCGVATDDTIFIHRDRDAALDRLHKLDNALQEAGMTKNANKDINAERSMVALGCELSASPPSVEAERHKMARLFAALADVVIHPSASPMAINSALGVAQWFALLQRPVFSVYDAVYEYVRRTPAHVSASLPCRVRNELAVSCLLMPFLGCDLSREFLPFITCCDASVDFGFGVCALNCGKATTEELGRLAERRGDYIRLFPQAGDPEVKDRIGQPHFLPFRKQEFKTIICKKATWKAHSCVLEAHALLLGLKWILRSEKNHGHRVPIFIDAKAVLGAVSKGRSSARALHGALRHIAALCLGTDSLLRLVYIPTESNPADLPSRGSRYRVHPQKRVHKRTLKSRLGTRTERLLQRLHEFEDKTRF